jgi:hypothetical protein
MNDKTKKRLISIFQMTLVFSTYLWARYFLPTSGTSGRLFLFSPLFMSIFVSFELSLILSVNINLKDAMWISTPVTVAFLILYGIDPLVFRYDLFTFYFVIMYVLPLTLAIFLLSSLAAWTGSLIRKRLSR